MKKNIIIPDKVSFSSHQKYGGSVIFVVMSGKQQ